MDEDQWMYDTIMSEEVDMDDQNEQECGVNEPQVDCLDAFNTSQLFGSQDDVLQWAQFVAHENGFVAVIIRSDTSTGSKGRSSFVLIGCERSGEYRCRKKEFFRRNNGTRKCGCPFKLRGKPVVGGQGWMVKLMWGIHNHELAKSLVGHPYAGRLTKAEKTLIADMTKSMVKPRNILLTLKEHNANSCTTIKQIYNERSAFRSSIKGSDIEMQHLMKLLEWDQYIHWHRLKDEDVVHCIFWCHPDVVKITHSLPYAWELSKYVVGCIPLDSIHMFWRRLSFSDQGLSEPEVSIKEEMETICKRFEELDVCELDKFSNDYIKLFGGTNKFEELRMSLLVDGLTKVNMDKWMDITDMGYVIASRYNNPFIVVSTTKHDVYLKDRCSLPPVALLWSSNCHPQAKQWPTPYINRMQHYKSFMMFKRDYVDINED
ncbi:hypothetical protein GmHk_01G001760 [Glycine max]|nr:hypothetical protein GmHk_01G001760 [Glycine max]